MDNIDKPRVGDGRRTAGRALVERLALESGQIEWTGKPVAIFDIDGTLADTDWRRAFAKAAPAPSVRTGRVRTASTVAALAE